MNDKHLEEILEKLSVHANAGDTKDYNFLRNFVIGSCQDYANKKVEEAIKKLKDYSDCLAYCDCGDALERTGLYPNESTYYCMGCDETYVLTTKDTKKRSVSVVKGGDLEFVLEDDPEIELDV